MSVKKNDRCSKNWILVLVVLDIGDVANDTDDV